MHLLGQLVHHKQCMKHASLYGRQPHYKLGTQHCRSKGSEIHVLYMAEFNFRAACEEHLFYNWYEWFLITLYINERYWPQLEQSVCNSYHSLVKSVRSKPSLQAIANSVDVQNYHSITRAAVQAKYKSQIKVSINVMLHNTIRVKEIQVAMQ